MKYLSDLRILEFRIILTIENKCMCADNLKLKVVFPAAVNFYPVSLKRVGWEGRVHTVLRETGKAVVVKLCNNKNRGIYWPKLVINYPS